MTFSSHGSERPEVAIAQRESQRRDARQTNGQLIKSQPSSLSSRQRNHHDQGRDIMMMDRRAFSTALLAAAAVSLTSPRGMAANAPPTKARNAVLVHGLFADGSSWAEAKAKVLYAVQEPFHKALLTGKTTHAAWRSKPSFYAVSTEDRTIDPDLERFMAKRMGATTIEVKASHLSLISQPQQITDLILQAAGYAK